MLNKLHTLSIGLLCAFSAAFVSAYDGCYDYFGPDCGTFGIKAEYLFWTTKICDLDYVRKFEGPLGEDDYIFSIDGKDQSHNPGHKWRSGFRVGADYQCSYNDPWRYSAVYTFFRSTGSSDVDCKLETEDLGYGCVLRPAIPYAKTIYLGEQQVDPYDLEAAKSHTRFRLDLGDIEIIRTTPLCGPACFNVLLGIRGGYISHRWTTKYFYPDQVIDSVTNLTGSNTELNNHWRYSAFGPRIGGQFDWCLGCGFNLYLDGSLTALWGKARNSALSRARGTREMIGVDPEELSSLLENQCHSCYKAVMVAEGEGGVAFNWTCESFVVQGKIAASLTHFNGLSDHVFHVFPEGTSSGKRYANGNVDLYGLVVGLGVLF